MKKQILHTVLFLAGLLAILGIASYITMPKGDEKNIYNIVNVREKLNELAIETPNTIDVVVIGDSETYSAFSPMLFYQQYGFTSYICGTSLQRLCDSYAILQNVFSKQSPKVVIIESDSFFRFGGAYQSNDDKVMHAFETVLPVFKYHTKWKGYIKGGVTIGNNPNDYKGFKYRTAIIPYTGGAWMIETSQSTEMGYMVEDYLAKINELVETNGAKLLIVSVPSPANWDYEKHNATVLMADRLGVEYIDMNIDSNISHLDIDWLTDTLDAGNHLNFSGAKKFSTYMGKVISDKYQLSDHRGNDSYSAWDEALNKYNKH